METLELKTSQRSEMVDITSQINRIIKDRGWEDGILVVFSSHTTSALTVNENADPDVRKDIDYKMNDLVPEDPGFHHRNILQSSLRR